MTSPTLKRPATVTLSRRQIDDILRKQMGWEPIDVTSFWRLARRQGAS